MNIARGRRVGAGFALVVANILLASCGSDQAATDQRSGSQVPATRHVSYSCNVEPFTKQLEQQLRAVPDTVIAAGIARAAGVTQRVNVGDGTSEIATEFTLGRPEFLVGAAPNANELRFWIPGGTVDNLTQGSEQVIFTANDGRVVVVLTPQFLPDRWTAIYGMPVTRNAVLLGLGCTNSEGFTSAIPTTTSIDAYALDAASNRLAPAKADGVSGAKVATVAMASFVASVSRAEQASKR